MFIKIITNNLSFYTLQNVYTIFMSIFEYYFAIWDLYNAAARLKHVQRKFLSYMAYVLKIPCFTRL